MARTTKARRGLVIGTVENGMSNQRSSHHAHAIVLGGSMAGLLAARVLSDHFAQVTLVERDVLPEEVANRRGVPQGRHTHGLLASGQDTLKQLFPGLCEQLSADGAVHSDILKDMRWFFESGTLARTETEMQGLMLTRPFLETAIRTRVRQLRNVTVRDGVQMIGLLSNEAKNAVTGVQLQSGMSLTADLVVDATGRGSRACEWLRGMGYEPPAEERVEIGLSYTTRFFKREPHHLDGDLGSVVAPTPEGKRGGVMIAQEGNRWTVTLISHFVPAAGEELEAFRSFTALLPSTAIHDVVRVAEPIGDAFGARFPASIRRRYERLRRFPERFVVMGDAICSFNPIYGQGMSVSALEALALGEVVAAGKEHVGQRFFARASRIIDSPWTTAVGNDLRMPEAVGPRSAIGNQINRYVARLQRAAHTDPELAVAFMRVANLLDHPQSLFAPKVVWRVIRSKHAKAKRAGTQGTGTHASAGDTSPSTGSATLRQA